jgi:fibro-slime domain-containing protein
MKKFLLLLLGTFALTLAQDPPAPTEPAPAPVETKSRFPEQIYIDVVLRDFPINSYAPGVQAAGAVRHPDFENFTTHKASKVGGELLEKDDCGPDHMIGPTGQPLFYCEYTLTDPSGTKSTARMFTYQGDSLAALGWQATCNWEGGDGQPVLFAPGMVGETISYPEKPDAGATAEYVKQVLKETVITKAMDRCNNSHFDTWFSDEQVVGSPSKKIENVAITLNKDPNSLVDNPTYIIDSRKMAENGFFPLDDPNIVPDPAAQTYGKEWYRSFCPAGYKYAGSQYKCADKDDPTSLRPDPYNDPAALDWGSPLDVNDPEARNYGYTMMGYAEFKYYQGQGTTFSFSGDDDMWVFIDGVLVADLGGTHMPTPVVLNMDVVASKLQADPRAQNPDWSTGSKHDLHFFYADRQSDGSNLLITTTLQDLVPSGFAPIYINKATIAYKADGTYEILIWSSSPISEQSLNDIRIGAFGGNEVQSAFIIKNPDETRKDRNLIVTGIEFKRSDRDGSIYSLTIDAENGTVPSAGDLVSFWKKPQDVVATEIIGQNGKPVDREWFVPFQLSSDPGASIDEKPVKEKTDKTPINQGIFNGEATIPAVQGYILTPPDSGSNGMNSSGALSIGAIQATPSPAGSNLETSKAGEILLMPFPRAAINPNWKSENEGIWGRLPFADITNGYGLTTTPDQNANNPQFLKSGFVNGGQLTSGGPALCTEAEFDSDLKSCFNIQIVVTGPIMVNVSLYDLTGQFVSNYVQEITAEEFRAVQSMSEGSEDFGGQYGKIMGNNRVLANIGIYPVDSKGRKIGSGAYILKYDILAKEVGPNEAPFVFQSTTSDAKVQKASSFTRKTEVKTVGFRRLVYN